MDIFWFGVLNGSAISFITVYFARIGGTGSQVGLLGAMPAIVAILFTIPAGIWLQKGKTNQKVVTASFFHRIFYLLWVPIPVLFVNSLQIELLLFITFIMSFPGTLLQVGFNALFAESVPGKWRGYVAGVRNAFLAITTIVISLLCGQLLINIAFPLNYQIVFGIGFIGAILSSVHLLLLIKQLRKIHEINTEPDSVYPLNLKTNSNIKDLFFSYRFQMPEIKENWQFYKLMLLLFIFHIAQYICIPVFPVFWVNNLKLSDNLISIGNGVFFVTVFLGSTQISKLSNRYGNRNIVGIGAMLMAFYPAIMAFSKGPFPFFVASLIGGFAWALVGGLLVNYLLEKIPEENRPPYLSLYNLIFYSAVLIGSLSGPEIVKLIGLPVALILFSFLRLGAGAAIIWKG